WWNTLHQPSTGFTSTVDASMRTPLLISAFGFLLLFIALHLKAMQNEIMRRRVKAMRVAEVERGDRLMSAGAE
ncbi:MAG TPA: heme transporter HemC, partial [Hyphomicrobium sp.]|nr:heme transporter HemC [Hyphomicrobium sp.]